MKSVLKNQMAKLIFALLILFSVSFVHAQDPIWDANKIILTKKKLAPGVFGIFPKESYEKSSAIPKPTSGGFIIGKKGVLVVESFLNADLMGQLLALIREETELPIKYAINTSYHGDHSYGNYVLPSSTIVVQHQGTSDYITKNFEEDKKFMITNFGAGRGIEKVVSRKADVLIRQGDLLKIDLGGKNVEIYTFGFGQTPGDLYIWEPDAKILWTGNVWASGKPALPWLLDGRGEEVSETMKKIRDFLPNNAIVIPGHDLPIKKADLSFAIEYLDELHKQVSDAVKKGWSLEKTLQEVQMDKYKGYVIYDWVHFQVNVTNTYKELSQNMKTKRK